MCRPHPPPPPSNRYGVRNRIWPPRRDVRSGFLIGVGGTLRYDWPTASVTYAHRRARRAGWWLWTISRVFRKAATRTLLLPISSWQQHVKNTLFFSLPWLYSNCHLPPSLEAQSRVGWANPRDPFIIEIDYHGSKLMQSIRNSSSWNFLSLEIR